jgi:hypothetical protein
MAFLFIRGPEGIQTPNLLIRSQMLYSVELRNHFFRMANIQLFFLIQTEFIEPGAKYLFTLLLSRTLFYTKILCRISSKLPGTTGNY